jgi:ketosteroid isomerase-like protein
MKNPYLVILLTLALSSLVLAKDKDTAAAGDAEQAIPKIEQELLDALLKSDTSAAEKYLADSAVFTDPDGAVSSKAQFISEVKSGTLKLESSKYADMKVQAADADMAVVTYRSTDKGTYKGKDISGEYRWIDVFAKRGGRWQIVVGQGTKIAKEQTSP